MASVGLAKSKLWKRPSDMPIQFDQTTAGVLTLQAPASGSYTLQLPSGNGSSNQYLVADGSGGLTWGDLTGFSNISPALNTASPNNTTNVSSLSVTGGTTNVFFALATSTNNGTVQAQVADGTAAGGNARGSASFDFQLARAAATQVAGVGNSSIVGGYGNTASGIGATVIGGKTNAAPVNYAFIGGGESNNIGVESGVILGGYQNSIGASANYSIILGGRANSVDQQYQAILGGYGGSCNGTPALTVLPTANPIGASTTNAFIGAGYAAYSYSDSNANSVAATLTGSSTITATNQILLRTNSVYLLSYNGVFSEPFFPLMAARSGVTLIRRGGATSTTTIISGTDSSLVYKSGLNDTIQMSPTANTTYGAFGLQAVGSVGHAMTGQIWISFMYIEY